MHFSLSEKRKITCTVKAKAKRITMGKHRVYRVIMQIKLVV